MKSEAQTYIEQLYAAGLCPRLHINALAFGVVCPKVIRFFGRGRLHLSRDEAWISGARTWVRNTLGERGVIRAHFISRGTIIYLNTYADGEQALSSASSTVAGSHSEVFGCVLGPFDPNRPETDPEG